MIEVIPALMPESLDDVRANLARFKGLVQTVQLDLMDGAFVQERTWPYTPMGRQEFAALASQDEGLPLWREIDVEVDLMVAEPEEAARDWLNAGAARIIVHVESIHEDDIFRKLRPESAVGMVPGAPECGIALNIDTDEHALEPYMDAVDFIQCMGIATIGYQGEPFDERVIGKIERLRNMHPDVTISVDGGVNRETAPKLVAAGATRLVSGSAILGAENPKSVINELRALG